ncbi:MAG: sugar phosphate nucleotidyltransferase [Promethearchaeia archaeon]
MVKGIILSGGWGTRLRPLTCTIPKTLIPVVNKPVIERQMMLLKKAGVEEIVLAVSVMAKELKQYFGDGDRLGLKIHYTKEENPMGTAGAIKLAEDYLKDDNFFMLNGDVILNFDFKEMYENHEKYGSIGTIASREVDDPSRYGVLIIDQETQQIQEFLEKQEYHPPEGKVVPMPINAGVYILEPQIFDYIEPHRKVSIEKEVFPVLADKRYLYHYPISGIWKDVGKPFELLQGNILLLKDLLRKKEQSTKNLIGEGLHIEGMAEIFPPTSIGNNVTIRNNCKIGPNVVIGDNVYIGANTEIRDAIIYSESYISQNVKIENAIISNNCQVDENVELTGNGRNLVILASHVRVRKNLQLIAPDNDSISVCHHEIVKESMK